MSYPGQHTARDRIVTREVAKLEARQTRAREARPPRVVAVIDPRARRIVKVPHA
jgi:hypothetical protein